MVFLNEVCFCFSVLSHPFHDSYVLNKRECSRDAMSFYEIMENQKSGNEHLTQTNIDFFLCFQYPYDNI